MRTVALALASLVAGAAVGLAQQRVLERLPPHHLDVVAPSERVLGEPGAMEIRETSCRSVPLAEVRRRIVEVAVQEWGFFGFKVLDRTQDVARNAPRRPWRPRAWLDRAESARVAPSIAGYWSSTPGGGWILDQQNERWRGPTGIAARWQAPWSAAFISWVMCEGGLGQTAQFRRAVAHHVYIDQAIRARAASSPTAAFVAHDIGTAPIVPGDLLCSASRPAYRTLAERQRQMGDGARTHCDIVVKVDEAGSRVLAIGGNVRGAVSLKLLRAERAPSGHLRPAAARRPIFAHLTLQADAVELDALDRTPTMQALVCGQASGLPPWLAAARVIGSDGRDGYC